MIAKVLAKPHRALDLIAQQLDASPLTQAPENTHNKVIVKLTANRYNVILQLEKDLAQPPQLPIKKWTLVTLIVRF
jgi:hypothetical protein